jgi:hypothetical protein
VPKQRFGEIHADIDTTARFPTHDDWRPPMPREALAITKEALEAVWKVWGNGNPESVGEWEGLARWRCPACLADLLAAPGAESVNMVHYDACALEMVRSALRAVDL